MATEKQKMGEKVPIDSDQEKHAHLKKLLDSFDTAMLVTGTRWIIIESMIRS